jgi:hypothetical protein
MYQQEKEGAASVRQRKRACVFYVLKRTKTHWQAQSQYELLFF